MADVDIVAPLADVTSLCGKSCKDAVHTWGCDAKYWQGVEAGVCPSPDESSLLVLKHAATTSSSTAASKSWLAAQLRLSVHHFCPDECGAIGDVPEDGPAERMIDRITDSMGGMDGLQKIDKDTGDLMWRASIHRMEHDLRFIGCVDMGSDVWCSKGDGQWYDADAGDIFATKDDDEYQKWRIGFKGLGVAFSILFHGLALYLVFVFARKIYRCYVLKHQTPTEGVVDIVVCERGQRGSVYLKMETE